MTEELIRENGFDPVQFGKQIQTTVFSKDFIKEVNTQIKLDDKSDVEIYILIELCSKFKRCPKEFMHNIKNMVFDCWTWRDEDLHDDLYNTLRSE